MGALVMWMAAGFAMLEAGLVRSKIQLKFLPKTSPCLQCPASCTWFWLCHYVWWRYLPGGIAGGDTLVADALSASKENGFGGDSVIQRPLTFFFQVVFVATAMSIVSGAVAERMKLWAFLAFAVVMTGVIYPWKVLDLG